MLEFDIFIPTKVLFGAGTTARLKSEAPKYGKKALIVTTGLRKTNTIQRVKDLLLEADLEFEVYDKVEGNPKAYNIDDAVALFKDTNCDFVIGVGGGSAMDSAKAVSVVAKNGGGILDYVPMPTAKRKGITEAYPIIAISTTAGTGSEVTMFAVVTIPDTHEKPGLGYPCMYPNLAIVDPELTLSMPPKVTAAVGIDTFFHAMENYLSKSANAFTDLFSLQAMKWVVTYLPRAYQNPQNVEARSYLHLANMIAGYSITIGSPATLHAISHAISGITDIPHGEALAMGSVAYLNYTWDADINRHAQVARLLDPTLVDQPDKAAARASSDSLKRFLNRLDLKADYKTLKLSDAQVKKIVQDIYIATPRIANQSRKDMTKEDIQKLIESAL